MRAIHKFLLTLTCVMTLSVPAFSVTWNYGQVHVSASDSPTGGAPWATLVFVQNGANTVDFTLTHNASSTAGQFLRNIYLNIVPFVGGITMTSLDETQATIDSMATGNDAFAHDGATGFDMFLAFQNSGGAGRLNPGESVSWRAEGTGLTTAHFDALSGGNHASLSLIHIQGIAGGLSSHIEPNAVPEPATMAVLGLGALVSLRRRRQK